ncbi:Stage 0 sporulation protein J [Gammaproteobacteria bacterium]|nr:Stage 0 sporulation protein J [Gammaproteobacteria bacterium]
MSGKQKRFLGTPLSAEIAKTIRDGQEQGGEINVESIPLGRIDVDEENPRRTGFSPGSLADPEAVIGDNANLRQTWEGLQNLAASIKSVGVQQPIKVYRHGDRFRVAFGERRFLASLIAEKATIPAWILQEKPKYLRNIQYIENMQREDLTAWERISNIQAIIGECASSGEGEMTVSLLTGISGMSKSRASHYLSIVNGPEDVRELIRTGIINNIEKGGYLSRIKDDAMRAKAIKLFQEGKDIKAVDAALHQKQPPSVDPAAGRAKLGRPRTRVNLGQTANTALLRKIMTGIAVSGLELPDNESPEWQDLEAVAGHWKNFLGALEREIKQGRGG